MAKGIYIGIDNIARKVKKMYIGKEGKARKVIKGYIGVKETYKVLDYIESTGTQYIDTGIIPKTTTRVVIEVAYTTITSSHLMGWGSSGGAEAFYWGMTTTEFVANVSGNYTANLTGISADTNRHIFDLKKGSLKFDGVEFATTNTLTDTATTGQTLYLFGRHVEWNTAVEALNKVRVYSCKIYNGDTLIRNFTPILDDNEIACLYDKISKKLYYNKGTGNFTAGNETGEIIEVSKARKFYVSLYPKYVKNITRKLSMEYSAFGALKEYIICAGGRDTNGATTASVEGYTKEGVQHVLTSLTQKRERHTCKALGDYVLVIGGATATSASNNRMTNTVETYNNNLVKGTASAINKAVYDFGVGANDEHLIQAGGTYYSAESNQAQSYDKNLVKTSITILSEQKQFLSGGNVGEFILFLGGTPKNNNIDIYDNKNVRTTISRPSIYANNVRDINGASMGKNLFYFCGQVGTTSTYYDKLLAFDENLIQKTATLPAKSSNCNAFNAGDEYVVASIGTSTCIYNNNMVLEEQTTKEKWLGSPLNRSCASNEEFAMTGNGWGSETELFNF